MLARRCSFARRSQTDSSGDASSRSHLQTPAGERRLEFSGRPRAEDRFLGSDQIHPARVAWRWYVTLGGEIREVFEQVGNDNWGKQHYTNTFFLQRVHAAHGWHLGQDCSRVRSAEERVRGRFARDGPRPIDEKKTRFRSGLPRAWDGAETTTGSCCESAGRS